MKQYFFLAAIWLLASKGHAVEDASLIKWVGHGSMVSTKDNSRWHKVAIACEHQGKVQFIRSSSITPQNCETFHCPKSTEYAVIAGDIPCDCSTIDFNLTETLDGEYFSLDYFSHRTARCTFSNIPGEVSQFVVLADGATLSNRLFISFCSIVKKGYSSGRCFRAGNYIAVPIKYLGANEKGCPMWEAKIGDGKCFELSKDRIHGNSATPEDFDWMKLEAIKLSESVLEKKCIWVSLLRKQDITTMTLNDGLIGELNAIFKK